MSVSAVGGGSGYYGQIASGKAIQSAADGAAEKTIIEGQTAQINGYDVGADNAKDGQNLLKVADGALDGVSEQLERMRELAVQASNTAVLSDSDRQMIQGEIEQIKQSISSIASNTEFNTKKLLDGSFTGQHIASGPDGDGQTIDIGSAALDALGIKDFDVTGNFDIGVIDQALSKVSSTRSDIGAQSNALDYTINYNSIASLNLTKSRSQMEDADIAEAASELKKQRTLQDYQLMVQKKKMEAEQKKLNVFQI